MTYIVTTRDVDGKSQRKYATAAAAKARFEEMYGYPIENAVWEMFSDESETYPEWTEMPYVKGVSNYGCVVTIEWQNATQDVHCLKCDYVWTEFLWPDQEAPDVCPHCGNEDKQQTVYLTPENN